MLPARYGADISKCPPLQIVRFGSRRGCVRLFFFDAAPMSGKSSAVDVADHALAVASRSVRRAEVGLVAFRILSGYHDSGETPDNAPVACARMMASSWVPNRNTVVEM
jgi:hypothetical protein